MMKKTLLFLMCSCLAFVSGLNANPYGSQGSSKITHFGLMCSNPWQTHSTVLACMVANIINNQNNKRAISPNSVISTTRAIDNEDSNQTSKRRVSFSDENTRSCDCVVKSPSPAPTPTNDAEMVVVGLAIRRPISVADSFSSLHDCVVKSPSPAPTPTTEEAGSRLRSSSSDSDAGGYFFTEVTPYDQLKAVTSYDQFCELHVSPGTPGRRKRMTTSYSYGSNDELRSIGLGKHARENDCVAPDPRTPTPPKK